MPFYQDLSPEDLQKRVDAALAILSSCALCPRACGINRLQDQTGFCKAREEVRVNSVFPHHGEEPCLSGTRGSGTVFFSHCTMRCVFCQNYQISHEGHGEIMTVEQLASEMLGLQEKGCHNINLVTATQYVPQILQALSVAIPKGLNLPIVYNTNGFDSPEALALLDGIVDIYLPDIKYAGNEDALHFSSCRNYVESNQKALREMWRQVGPLIVNREGIAQQGMIVRHLVLPDGKAGSRESLLWLARNLSEDAAVSLMAQYTPMYQASRFAEINRRITQEEYFAAVEALHEAGLSEGWIQEWEGMDGHYIIDFLKRKRERLI